MRKTKVRNRIAAIAIAALVSLTSACGVSTTTSGGNSEASADFPKKPITLIVPFAAGGGTDSTARALAKAAEKHLGQPITVVNKTGGGGSVGMSEAANASPDGYTVGVVTVELTTLSHLGLSPLTYESFKPIAMMNYEPAAITVRADSEWESAQQLLDFAKANPGKLKIGNSGTGAIWHLAAATVEKATGAQFNHIPFEGAAPAITALMGGHVDAVTVSPPEVKAQVEAGKLRSLAVIDEKASAVLPDVKTLQEEIGIEFDYVGTWRGLGVPKGTPDDIAGILSDAFLKGMQEPEFIDHMKNNGLTIVSLDAAGFGQYLKENHDRFGKLIPELGLSNK